MFSKETSLGIEWSDAKIYPPFSFSTGTFSSISAMMASMLRAVEWAHNRGIYARLHSCGNIMSLLPDILDTGVDALNPLEVKAGMDAVKIKKELGDKLVLHGGINAVNARLWKGCTSSRYIAGEKKVVPLYPMSSGQ